MQPKGMQKNNEQAINSRAVAKSSLRQTESGNILAK